MKIGIDIRNIGKQRTGDETVFLNLVKNLAKIDNVNEYRLFTDLAENVLPEISQKLGILDKTNFRIVSLKSSNKFCWNLWTLPNYLRKNPVDVYHTQYIVPFFVSKKISSHTKSNWWNRSCLFFKFLSITSLGFYKNKFDVGVKIVTHIHDVSFNAYPEYISKTDLFFLKILIPRSLKRADRIVAISEFTKKEIIENYQINPDKIAVVSNAVGEEFEKNFFSEEKLEEVRKKYSLSRKFILYVGTLQPRKNLPKLLEAFSKIKEKIPGYKLVLVGNRNAHNFDKKIEEEIFRNNLKAEVIFPGYVSQNDLPIVYRLASVFVLPSLYEGFGIPLLEAMSQKIPVLASDIAVHREIASEAASYFNSKSVDDFSEKLYNCIVNQNLREKQIQLGSERAKSFSWEKSAQKMLSIYQSFSC